MNLNKKLLIFLFLLIAVTTIVKVICAPQINLSGFSAIFAVAIFAGFSQKKTSAAFLFPLICLFASDVLIQAFYAAGFFPFSGFYKDQWINYILIAALVLIGIALRKGKLAGIIAAVVAGPTLFFLISNYLVWARSPELGYSHDFGGLMECYRAGIPFYRNSVISTAIFLPSYLVIYQWMMKGRLKLINAE